MTESPRAASSRRAGTALRSVSSSSLDKVALYIRVSHSLRSRISQGEWRPGSLMPTIASLAHEYGVALVTIRQALRLLTADGLVTSTRGRGTFVCADAELASPSAGLRAAISDRLDLPGNCSIQVLKRTIARHLPPHFVPPGIGQYPQYVVIEKLHLLEDEPFAYMTVMVAEELYKTFPKGAERRQKILRLILDGGCLRLQRSHIEMVVTYADDQMAKRLRCAPLSALVRIRTSRIDTRRKVVLCHDAYYRGDRFFYATVEDGVELGRSSSVVLPDPLTRQPPAQSPAHKTAQPARS